MQKKEVKSLEVKEYLSLNLWAFFTESTFLFILLAALTLL